LEDQNVQLLERNQTIEEEYRKVLAFKTLMDSYKDQVASLETKNNELLREKNRVEYDLQHLTKKVQSLEEDKAHDTDQIQLLEDRLQEFEMNGKDFHCNVIAIMFSEHLTCYGRRCSRGLVYHNW
jgi:protein HOOK3